MKQSFENYYVNQHEESWIADSAMVIGSVVLEKDTSVWYHSVIRGDAACITIQEGSNIQDLCTLHADNGYDVMIGKYVTIGHNCIIHGCHIGDESMIGMGSIIMNGAKIGKHCIIGAGSLVLEEMIIPDNSLVVGSPAKVIKQITPEQIEKIQHNAKHYIELSKKHQGEQSC